MGGNQGGRGFRQGVCCVPFCVVIKLHAFVKVQMWSFVKGIGGGNRGDFRGGSSIFIQCCIKAIFFIVTLYVTQCIVCFTQATVERMKRSLLKV